MSDDWDASSCSSGDFDKYLVSALEESGMSLADALGLSRSSAQGDPEALDKAIEVVANATAPLTGTFAFCTGDNVASCEKYLNHTLSVQGLPTPLHIGSQEPKHVAAICNTLYQLLEHRMETNERLRKLEAEQKRLSSNVTMQDSAKSSLRAELEMERRKSVSLESAARMMEKSHKKKMEALKERKERAAGDARKSQDRSKQFRTTINKLEKEVSKLQEKLSRAVITQRKATKACMVMTEPLPVGIRQDADIIAHARTSYEAEINMLQLENETLRDCLRHHHRDILRIAQDASGETNEQGFVEDGVFDLPFHMVQDTLEKANRDRVEQLRVHVGELLQSIGRYQEEAKHLRNRVEELERVAEDQEVLIAAYIGEESTLATPTKTPCRRKAWKTPGGSLLNASTLSVAEAMRTRLEQDQQLFEEKVKHFDEERRLFAQHAIELGRTRAALELERETLDKERQGVEKITMSTPLQSAPVERYAWEEQLGSIHEEGKENAV